MPPDHLRADCASCAGLCCVAPAFAASSDFAVDKPAGQPCANLEPGFRCGIHGELRDRGYAGCTVFDCFGAGQQVTQVTFGGQDWRGTPEIAGPMFAAFAVMRQLHELLCYLADALSRPAAGPVHAELERARDRTERLTRGRPAELAALDVAAHRAEVNVLLLRASELVRADFHRADVDRPDVDRADLDRADLRGADLTGRDLSGADLSGSTLRGAYLIGSDLTGADLRSADLIGADLRGADLSGADLTGALFLSQFQINGARGDRSTRLSASVVRPSHWGPDLGAAPGPHPLITER